MSYGYFKKKNNYPHKDDEFLEALDTHYDTRSFIDIFDVNYFNIEDFIFTCERFIEEINDMNSFSLFIRDFNSEINIPSFVPGSMYFEER